MKKRWNYKIIAALTSFTFSLLCLTATTLAWFSLSNTLLVDDLNINITSGADIELGLLANESLITELRKKYDNKIGEWDKDIFYIHADGIVTEDILLDFGYIRKTDRLVPVSSAYYENWFDQDNIASIFPQFTKQPKSGNIKGDAIAVNSDDFGYYYQFEFFIRATKYDMYMFLNDKTYLNADYAKNATVGKRDNVDIDELNKVENYLRLSILTENDYIIYEPHPHELIDGSYEKTVFFGRLDADPLDGFFDFNSEYKEILYGNYQNPGSIIYDEEARIIDNEYSIYNGGFWANSFALADPIDIEKSLANGLVGETEQTTLKPEDIKNADYQNKVENALSLIEKEKPTRIVVSIWAEGWDKDCNILSQNSNFQFKLVFNAKDPRSYL